MMTGQGPFGNAPAGAFNRRLSGDGLLYLEPSPRRIRGLLGDEVVVDSTRVWLLLEHRRLPRYYFPEADIRPGLLVANGRGSRSQLKGRPATSTCASATGWWPTGPSPIRRHRPRPRRRWPGWSPSPGRRWTAGGGGRARPRARPRPPPPGRRRPELPAPAGHP